MKNVMIYGNPSKAFVNSDWSNETETLVRIQIDNSLEWWNKNDILLYTNFPFEYNGVKAIEVPDELYCDFSSGTPTKINTICWLFEQGLENDVYWFHDFDAFQLEPLNFDIGSGKLGITDYCLSKFRWSTGSLFYRDCADVFDWIKTAVYKYRCNEEIALLALTRHDKHGVRSRIEHLNITYNFALRKRNLFRQCDVVDYPIKVIHFHPWDKRPLHYVPGKTNMDVCVYGDGSPIGKPLVTEKLTRIFKDHGIT